MTHKLFWLLALTCLGLHAQTANTISPSSGTGNSQLFITQWTDNQGAGGLVNPVDGGAFVILVIGPNVNLSGSNLYPSNSCPVWYNVNTSQLGIVNDAGNSSTSTSIGGASVSNSQCTLDAAQSTFSNSAPNFTVGFHVTTKAGYVGAMNTYMRIADLIVGGDSGYIQKGSWTATAPAVITIGNVTLSSSAVDALNSGMLDLGRLLSVTVPITDSLGYADITSATIVIANTAPGSSGPPANSCSLQFLASSQSFYLDPDAGGQNWNPDNEIAPGYFDGDTNTQCYGLSQGAAISGSGNTLTLTVQVGFNSAFSGLHTIWVNAANSTETVPYVTKGSVTVTTPFGLGISHMLPGSSTGAESQVLSSDTLSEVVEFEVCAEDAKGFGHITSVTAGFQPEVDGPPPPGYVNQQFGCWVKYDPVNGDFYLLNDSASNWALGGKAGITWALSNSTCKLFGQYSNAPSSGNAACPRFGVAWHKAASIPPQGAFFQTARATNDYGLDTGWVQEDYWVIQDPGGPGSVQKPLIAISAEPSSIVNQTVGTNCAKVIDSQTLLPDPGKSVSVVAGDQNGQNKVERFTGFHIHEQAYPNDRTASGVELSFPGGTIGTTDDNGRWCPLIQVPSYAGLYNYTWFCPSCINHTLTLALPVRHLEPDLVLALPNPPNIIMGQDVPELQPRLWAHDGLDFFMRSKELAELGNIAAYYMSAFRSPTFVYRGGLPDGGTNDDLLPTAFFYFFADWHNDGKHFDISKPKSAKKLNGLKSFILTIGCSYSDVFFTPTRTVSGFMDVSCE